MRVLRSFAFQLVMLLYCSHLVLASDQDPEFLRYQNADQRIRSIDSLRMAIDRLSDRHAQIATWQQWANRINDPELDLAFRLLEYWILIDENKNPIKELHDLVGGLNQSNYLHLKVRGHQLLAYCYWLHGDYGRSMEHELWAYELYSDLPSTIFTQNAYYLYGLAIKYYHFRDYANAKKILFEAASLPQHKGPGLSVIFNTVGMCFRHMRSYDSAAWYFKAAYREAVKEKHHTYEAITSGNLGITLYYQNRYEEAIPLLRKDIAYCLEDNRATDNAVISMAFLSDILLKRGKLPEARALALQIIEMVKKDGNLKRYDVLENLYPVLSKVYLASGDKGEAYRYAAAALDIKDSLARVKNALVLAGAQNVVSARKHMAELKELEAQKKMQILTRNSLLAGVLLLGAIVLLMVNRKRLIYQRNQEKLEAEKRLLDTELAAAESQLGLFTKNILEKNRLIEQFKSELEARPKTENALTPSAHEEMMMQLQNSTILTDDEWDDFRKLFEKVHGGYLQRLKEKMPGLSPADVRFMALSKLKLSNKEMAGVLGISPDSVRMSRHRLRKKLKLPEEASIEELVETV